jgi:hypothetical protein
MKKISSRTKAILFFAGIAAIVLTFAYAINFHVYELWMGFIILGSLLVSFVSAILWLLHDFKARTPQAKMIRGTLLAFWILIAPLLYAVIGFMAEGASNSWGSR